MQNADLIRHHVIAAHEVEPGSDAALSAAQRAIFHLIQELAPALGDKFVLVAGEDAKVIREKWIDLLQFLVGTQSFPSLAGLSIGLQELRRGVTVPELQEKAGGSRGGLSSTDELLLQAWAIEAADELRSRCTSSDEYRAELKESETSYSTIEGYRKSVLAGPTEFHPRPSYILAWADLPPEILLQQVIWAIQDARKKPRKIKHVAT